MPFPYKTVLITGATSGIGQALAERMIAAGIFVIAVGRRRDRLDTMVAQYGADKVAAEVYDVSDLNGMEEWAKKITTTYPTVDSIVLNAGWQRSVDFTNPSSISLPSLAAELTTNYLSPLHNVVHFLPHLIALGPSQPASIVLVSSGLAIVPIPRCANYCASKAAVHSLAWTLRSQLSGPASPHTNHIRVIEIVPPAVQTELHAQQPDVVAAGQSKIGVPLDMWADETWTAMRASDGDGGDGRAIAGGEKGGEKDEWEDELMVSMARERFGKIEEEKRKGFKFFEDLVRKEQYWKASKA